MGELTVLSPTAFHPSTHITIRDILIDKRDNPSLIQIHLKVSKTDQERKGVSIFIGKTGDDICPVAALTAYLAIQDHGDGPLFQFKDRTPLTKRQVYPPCMFVQRCHRQATTHHSMQATVSK